MGTETADAVRPFLLHHFCYYLCSRSFVAVVRDDAAGVHSDYPGGNLHLIYILQSSGAL